MISGDDLIGPRDIKRGVHLLTNAEMALLIEDAEAEAAQEQQPARARGRLKRRDSAVLRGDKLTEEQITQVTPDALCWRRRSSDACHSTLLRVHKVGT